MRRRLTTVVGAVAAVAGFAAALASLALPWARYRMSLDGVGDIPDHAGNLAVYQLELGRWYVAALLAVLALLALAATTDGRAARVAGTAAVLIAPGWMPLVYVALTDADPAAHSDVISAMGASVSVAISRGPGMLYGQLGLPLLTVAAALLAVRRPARAAAGSDAVRPAAGPVQANRPGAGGTPGDVGGRR